MTANKTKKIFLLYLSSLLLYSLGLLIILYLPYYQKTLTQPTLTTLTYLYLSYLILAPLFYLFSPQLHPNKPYLFFSGLKNLFTRFKTAPEEKVAFLFLLVKIFFLPIMLNFFFNNFQKLVSLENLSLENFLWYPFLLNLFFALDTLIFSFGYAFESPSLKNVVKSVEPTFFGWFVALICYPPFNNWTGNYIPWGANDYADFGHPTTTFIMRIIILFLLLIYLWATFALGTKASNLTNRGIVTKFPYSIIRHPAYVSKTLIWWLTLLPVISWPFTLGLLFWTVIYYFRSITEERHLKQDPDYLSYCQKVKWKFFPFVY